MKMFQKQPTLLISSLDNPQFLEGVFAECDPLGWRVVNLRYAANFVDFNPKPLGAIIAYTQKDTPIEQLRKRGIPIVWADNSDADVLKKDGRVLSDRPAGGQLAADTFVARGFKNLGYVNFDTSIHSDTLLKGFRERAKSHGMNLHLCQLHDHGESDTTIKYEMMRKDITEWVKDIPKPVAILGLNYVMAVRISVAVDIAGYCIPEQIAVACLGENEGLCRTAPVPLSTIDLNREELGRRAVQLIKRMVDGKSPPRDPVYVPIKGFIERRSTDILAVPDTRVAKAVRFMWDNIQMPLKVNDVARAVAISRNTLERAFRKMLGRGVNAELRRKRMERCKELLRSTPMTIEEIARYTGLSSSRHLHRSFMDDFGETPKQYRKTAKE